MKQLVSVSGYLAVIEIWRNRGRFLLVSLVIGLITLLVLFIAALGEGLGNGNREYISKLDGQLIVYQAKSDFLIQSSRLGRDRLAAVRRVPGVADAGVLGTANAAVILPGDTEPLKVALLGVEPGHMGEPQVLQGQQLSSETAEEVIIDRNTALRGELEVGDALILRATQGTRDEFYELRVAGITDGQQYSLQPSIFVPFFTWDRIRPKSEAEVNTSNPVANVIFVKLDDPARQMKSARAWRLR
jgi:putative ABC transport system permease protein